MDRRRDNLISILNNDDNPSFFIRPSGPMKEGASSLPDSRPQLHVWPSSGGGGGGGGGGGRYSYAQDPPIFSPQSPASYYHHGEFTSSSHPVTLTPSPEPTFVRSYSHSSAPRSPINMNTNTTKRMSIQSITHPLQHTPETEPMTPQSPSYGDSTGTAADADAATTTTTTTAPSGKPAKKNKYPCPYGASHGCGATFTTSGHAARHGKKHTGEKSVICPICNKAFTRKDNMKQHKRTHRSAITGTTTTATTTTTTASVDGQLQSSSRWPPAKEPSLGDPASLSHSDADTPPTPASDLSASFALNADETARRLAHGEAGGGGGRVKRHSISSASASSSRSRSGMRSSGGVTRSARRR